VAKAVKTRRQLELMIAAEVRGYPRCQGFKSISLYYSIFEDAQAGIVNWLPSVRFYGDAKEGACEAALREIIPRLQRQYDMEE
jgi:hypothetical protein